MGVDKEENDWRGMERVLDMSKQEFSSLFKEKARKV